MAEAVTFLHRDGIIVLDKARNTSHLDAWESILGPEAEEIAQDPNHHFNFGRETRNMDQAPPLKPELMFADIWANPFAVAILKSMMGPDLVCHYANGNTALQATGRQPVHSDMIHRDGASIVPVRLCHQHPSLRYEFREWRYGDLAW